MKNRLVLLITLICLAGCSKEEVHPLIGHWGEFTPTNTAYKIIFTETECMLYNHDKLEEDSVLILQSNYTYNNSQIILTKGYTWRYKQKYYELTIEETDQVDEIDEYMIIFNKDYTPTKLPSSTNRCGTYNGRTLYKGSKGGCYYYNSKGNKTYVDRSECKC